MLNTTEQEIRTCQGMPFSGPIVRGAYGGLCMYDSCHEPMAIYYNHVSEKYYCPTHAKHINETQVSSKVESIFGHKLCTAPLWHVTFVNESGQISECYIDAYDCEGVEKAWVLGQYVGYRTLSEEDSSTWNEWCDEDNILSMERDGETGDMTIPYTGTRDATIMVLTLCEMTWSDLSEKISKMTQDEREQPVTVKHDGLNKTYHVRFEQRDTNGPLDSEGHHLFPFEHLSCTEEVLLSYDEANRQGISEIDRLVTLS